MNIPSVARFDVLMAVDITMDLQDVMLCSLVHVSIVEEPVDPIIYLVDGGSWSLRNFGVIIKAKQHHIMQSVARCLLLEFTDGEHDY